MGGGGHHGHEPPYKIPDYKIYKVEEVPELMACRRALKGMGLKDPWLRNEVWKYSTQHSKFEIVKLTVGRGMKWGLLAAIITTGVGYAIDAVSEDHNHGGHGHTQDDKH